MNLLVDFEETDWHYFYNKTKKDIQMYSYMLPHALISHSQAGQTIDNYHR